jgi:proteasome lid subunit RPN8/RPN11
VVLKLCPKQLQFIRTHAESTYPDECCGLLLGKLSQDSKTVVEVMATENAWNPETAESFPTIDPTSELGVTKRSHYTIAPESMLKAQREARDRQLAIIGIYHSHPDHPATPSEFDRVYAWQQYSYIIVSVQQGKACEFKSWSLDDDHQFQLEEMIVEPTQLKT